MHLPNIGSVCSGGRYDNLAGVYTRQQLPGIGASLGLDRLLAAMEELSLIETVDHAGPGPDHLLRQEPAARLSASWPPSFARPGWASNSTPNPSDSASSSSTPTSADFAWP